MNQSAKNRVHPDSRVRLFDTMAKAYGRSEGVGATRVVASIRGPGGKLVKVDWPFENEYTKPDKYFFHPVDLGDDFYGRQVGSRTARLVTTQIPLKQIFDGTEKLLRAVDRIKKLKFHLRNYGAEIFSGYARASLPAKFVKECLPEIFESAKRDKNKVGDLGEYVSEQLCPDRLSGIRKVSARGNGLKICAENLQIFSAAKAKNYLVRYWHEFYTRQDLYDFEPDDVLDVVRELEAIRISLHKWRRKKWPCIELEVLLKEPFDLYLSGDLRGYELHSRFVDVYLCVLEGGRDAVLPKFKFRHQT